MDVDKIYVVYTEQDMPVIETNEVLYADCCAWMIGGYYIREA